MLVKSLFLLAALAPFAIADVEFTSPAAGNSISAGGKTLSVTWKESGDDPPISSFTTYTLFLCAGGNEPESQVRPSPPGGRLESFNGNLLVLRNHRCKSHWVAKAASVWGTRPRDQWLLPLLAVPPMHSMWHPFKVLADC